MPDITSSLLAVMSNGDSQKTAAIVLVIVGLVGFLLWMLDNLFAPISVIPYGIVGFFGRRGTGKSFGMTTYARRWRHAKPNQPVFTNMEKFVLPGYGGRCTCRHECIHTKHNCAEEWEKDSTHDAKDHHACRYILNKCKAIHTNCTFAQIEACRDGLVAIDEAGVFISSMNFVDRKNRQFARWLVSTRHFKVMVLLTAHTPGTVNNRLRDVIDQFILMEAYTTIKLFKGLVYDSGKAYGRVGEQSQTVWIPMWGTTSRSYNTDSLRIQSDAADVEIVGEDFEFPGMGGDEQNSNVTSSPKPQTSSSELSYDRTTDIRPNGMGALSRPAIGVTNTSNTSGLILYPDMDGLDAALLASVVAKTAETWNGRKTKAKITRMPTRRSVSR